MVFLNFAPLVSVLLTSLFSAYTLPSFNPQYIGAAARNSLVCGYGLGLVAPTDTTGFSTSRTGLNGVLNVKIRSKL